MYLEVEAVLRHVGGWIGEGAIIALRTHHQRPHPEAHEYETDRRDRHVHVDPMELPVKVGVERKLRGARLQCLTPMHV